MRKFLLILALFVSCSLSLYAQKPTTTKPSVAELISIMDSRNPKLTLSQVAAKNGFTYHHAGTSTSFRYVRKVNGNELSMGMFTHDNGVPYDVYAMTLNKKVVDSWMDQLKRLGYLFEGKTVEETMAGVHPTYTTTVNVWNYSKPSGYKVRITKIPEEKDYVISIER